MVAYKSSSHLLQRFIERRHTASSLLDLKIIIIIIIITTTDILLRVFASFTVCCSLWWKSPALLSCLHTHTYAHTHTHCSHACTHTLFHRVWADFSASFSVKMHLNDNGHQRAPCAATTSSLQWGAAKFFHECTCMHIYVSAWSQKVVVILLLWFLSSIPFRYLSTSKENRDNRVWEKQ